MKLINKLGLKKLAFLIVIIIILNLFGVFTHLFEKDFYINFQYPYNGNIEKLINQLKNNETPSVQLINSYKFNFTYNCYFKCKDVTSLRLVYLVKSSPENFDKRIAIRSTWGYEKRFSDVEIRTVFLIGKRNSTTLDKNLNDEYNRFKDLVQSDFYDVYLNNTYKTMMGFYWAKQFCQHSKFYMFVDDDYYVSTKNVLRFIKNPVNYPQYLKSSVIGKKFISGRRAFEYDYHLKDDVRLYGGYALRSSPHRHIFSKWYISLKDYPFHMWPPYVTAGACLLSRETLIDMYYASFYTKHFKFDDIYIALLAQKIKIQPFHCDEFNFYKKPYYKLNYKYTIASHGYGDVNELLQVWTEQKSMGNA